MKFHEQALNEVVRDLLGQEMDALIQDDRVIEFPQRRIGHKSYMLAIQTNVNIVYQMYFKSQDGGTGKISDIPVIQFE